MWKYLFLSNIEVINVFFRDDPPDGVLCKTLPTAVAVHMREAMLRIAATRTRRSSALSSYILASFNIIFVAV